MIVGWRSPVDGKVYDLEDFTHLGRVVPEPLLRSMAQKAKLDTRHQGDGITITSGLSCPRKILVQRMMPVTPDPTKMWKMQRGTWLHEMIGLSLGENPDWWTEEVAEDECVFEGEIFGVKMSCKIDALKKDYSTLVDWKFRADGAEKWIDPQGRAKEEDSAQLNMARLLIEQTTGKKLDAMKMYVWVMAGQTVRTEVPYMSEMQIGAIRPGGGDTTILEIFQYLNQGMEAWRKLAGDGDLYEVPHAEKQKVVAALPMVGEKMYRNQRTPSINMCTRYCEVQDECFACSGGI